MDITQLPEIRNRSGLQLIKDFEGFREKAYLCPAGIPTIGYGETHGVKLGMTISEENASKLLIVSYDELEDEIRDLVKIPLNTYQLGALVSFAYNLGIGNLTKSTLLRKLNAGDVAGASREFGRWTRAKGKILKGLVRRREAEMNLFLKED